MRVRFTQYVRDSWGRQFVAGQESELSRGEALQYIREGKADPVEPERATNNPEGESR